MKLPLSLLVLVIAAIIAPAAATEQQGEEMGWGQKAGPDSVAVVGAGKKFGICAGVPANWAYQGSPYNLGPLGSAEDYFRHYANDSVAIPPTTQVSVVSAPKHGKFTITPVQLPNGYARYDYISDVGYLGDDQLILKIELGEKSVTLVYFFHIQDIGDSKAMSLCNKTGYHWKISNAPEPAITSVW